MPKWNGTHEPIETITALKRQECREIAQETLEKVYRYVLPIMRKRNYRVYKLVEFLPKKANLLGLNVNHGQSISLRLRYDHNHKEFLPFENVLGTMLHELCHNTYGPHNAQFFSLLDELTEEMEDLMARGFKGDPFMGSGRTLGRTPIGSYMLNNRRSITPYSSGNGKLQNKKGRKLGGLGVRKQANGDRQLRQLMLEAAERRRVADTSCRTAKKVEELAKDEQDEVIDLTIDDEIDEKNETNESKSKAPEVIYILED